MIHKITIVRRRVPSNKGLNEELQWFGSSLGLFTARDKDKSCFRIFIELLKSTKKEQPITSDQISSRLNLSRGTVVHHLHKLENSGLVVSESSGYLLRVNNLRRLVDELEDDLVRACRDLREIAQRIDKKLN